MRNFFLLVLLLPAVAFAQQGKRDSLVYPKKYWSVETSVVWPIFPGIYKINFIRQVWEKKSFSGEVGIALNIQPERTVANEGAFSEEFFSLFYRQYFWKGFMVQIENNFAYGRLRNYPVSGKNGNFESYAIFHDFTGGYRFELLRRKKVGLTIIPQAGGGFTSYVNETWPRPEKPYWLVNMLVGMQF